MANWIVRTETGDFNRAREIAEDHRNEGYKVWMEDENGMQVDERRLRKERHHRPLRGIAIASLFWLGSITVTLSGFYLLGVADGSW